MRREGLIWPMPPEAKYGTGAAAHNRRDLLESKSMTLADSVKTPQRRINAHRGLVIDVPRWVEAHEYHRIQLARHGMLMHSSGIISGLEVVECQPPASSVLVSPGAALDPEGRLIVVAEPHRLDLPFNNAGLAHIALQYREVPDSPARRAGEDQDQALYTLEVFSISGGKKPPTGPYLELARVQVSSAESVISNAYDWRTPGADQIDIRFREQAGHWPTQNINIGIASFATGSEASPYHLLGTMELIKAINSATRYRARFAGSFDLSTGVEDCDLLIMAGEESFSLTSAARENLSAFLTAGGTLFGESCKAGGSETREPGAFGQSFQALAEAMGMIMLPVGRGHPLLSAYHIFSGPPNGVGGESSVMAAGGMVYSAGDYGSLWSGGHPESTVPRETIRSAIEFGVNLGAWAALNSREHSLEISSS